MIFGAHSVLCCAVTYALSNRRAVPDSVLLHMLT